MKKTLKWMGGIFLTLIIICTVIIIITVKSSMPRWEGEITIPGLNSKVTIKLDEYNVPHIYADNESDLFFTMGYVQAKDRFFQMDLSRRYPSGKLAELFGRRALETDTRMRKMMMQQSAEAIVKYIPDEMKTISQRFCDGINYFIENESTPLEYKLLRVKPEKWEEKDTVLIMLSIGWNLATSGGEISNYLIKEKLGEHWRGFLRDSVLKNGEAVCSAEELKGRPVPDYSDREQKAKSVNRIASLSSIFDPDADRYPASNNWVVDGTMTKTGKPILANDPHLAVVNPTHLYQIHFKGGGYDVAGFVQPGLPLTGLGHNDRIAWGITALQPDIVDYMKIKTKPGDDNYYQYKGEWKKFGIIKEKIKIKGEETPEIIEIKMTEFGPLYPFARSDIPPFAFTWTGMYPSNVFSGIINLSKAKNKTDVFEAAKDFSVPHCNLVYADKDGNIGYYPTGPLPNRMGRSGLMPQEPETVEKWSGMLDEKYKTYLLNPAKHYITTANNQVAAAPWDRIYSDDWIFPFRAERISNLLKVKRDWTINNIATIQSDTFSIEADLVLTALKDVKIEDSETSNLWEMLQKWNREFEAGAEPGLYLAFRENLKRNLLFDEIKNLSDEEKLQAFGRVTSLLRVLRPDNFKNSYNPISISDVWDDKNTKEIETKTDIVSRSLKDADKFLSINFSSEWKKMKWNKMHTVSFQHPLGAFWPLTKIYNRGPYGINGGSGIVQTASTNFDKPFTTDHMAVLRVVYDLSDFDNSLAIKNFGQSSNPFSDAYDDEIEIYLKAQYNQMYFSDSKVEENKKSEMILKPGN